MNCTLGLLSTAAVCAFVFASPATAQVAASPGDLHSPTVYTQEYRAEMQGYAPGYAGPFGALGAITAPITAPVAAMTGGGGPGGGRCGVVQDFNGRYAALCGL